jgi:hypothetical protein
VGRENGTISCCGGTVRLARQNDASRYCRKMVGNWLLRLFAGLRTRSSLIFSIYSTTQKEISRLHFILREILNVLPCDLSGGIGLNALLIIIRCSYESYEFSMFISASMLYEYDTFGRIIEHLTLPTK